jgi:hypothetical protein
MFFELPAAEQQLQEQEEVGVVVHMVRGWVAEHSLEGVQ